MLGCTGEFGCDCPRLQRIDRLKLVSTTGTRIVKEVGGQFRVPGANGRDYDIVSFGRDKAAGGTGDGADISN